MPRNEHENASPRIHDAVAAWLFAQDGVRRVLDVPAGMGAFAARCAQRGIEAFAGDVIEHRDGPGVTRVHVDLNGRLPFDDGFFDAVVCIEGIEHLQRPFDFVRECRRVLRTGGLLVVTTPNISALRSRWRWLLTGFHNKQKTPLDEGDPNPLHHVNMTSYAMGRYLLHTQGFRVVDVRTNRYKATALLFAPLALLSWLATWLTFRHETRGEPAQWPLHREVLRAMHKAPLLFGETMILCAVAAPQLHAASPAQLGAAGAAVR
jgi:2-polyprenyl-3-methyl-5-hydroxy-6-metoxy-1,4-benzoquinol methylase